MLRDEGGKIRFALREQLVGPAADLVPDLRRRKAGVLVRQRDICAVAPFHLETAKPQTMAQLQVLRAPSPIAIRKAVHRGEGLLVEQADRAKKRFPVLPD